MVQHSMIYEGDNLAKLPEVADNSVDLVYIDPPFNTGGTYELFWNETGERRAFEDRFGSVEKYIEWMEPRCRELQRVLKPTGSFYYHCDSHASHYIKAMLDEVFGHAQFRSEIIWRRNPSKGLATRGFANNHDTILYYTKSGEFTWNSQHIPYDPKNLDDKTAKKYCRVDDKGRRYRLDNLLNPNKNRPNLTYELLGVTRVWRWTRERMLDAQKAGIIIQTKQGAVPQLKRFLDEQKGRQVDDIWVDIAPLNSQAKERVGYPTQKPVALMERIISASSNQDDVVLDAFCGCGTTLVAAAGLGRRWIGIDQSPTACRVMADRLHRDLKLMEGVDYHVRTMQTDMDRLENMDPYDFQNWAVNALGGIPNPLKGADKGIDGRLRLVNTKVPETVQKTFIFARDVGSQLDLFDDYVIPIQVKQTKKVGRPDVDAFQTAMRRAECKMGIMVGFDFTKQAREEIRRARKKENLVIQPITVIEILDQQAA